MAAYVSLSKADIVSISNDLSTSVVALSSLAVSKGDPGYFGDLSPLFLESGGQLLPAGDHGRFVLDWAGSGPDAAAAELHDHQ